VAVAAQRLRLGLCKDLFYHDHHRLLSSEYPTPYVLRTISLPAPTCARLDVVVGKLAKNTRPTSPPVQ
jgi:hypothetical protein